MIVAIASDHRGVECKKEIIKYLNEKKHEVIDCSPINTEIDDYPDFAFKVCGKVVKKEADIGILVCRTGIGMSIAANKVKGIRCGMAYTDDAARLMREHNDANVIAFGASQMPYEIIEKRVGIFLDSSFLGGYHSSRIQQLSDIEQGRTITQTPYIDNEFK